MSLSGSGSPTIGGAGMRTTSRVDVHVWLPDESAYEPPRTRQRVGRGRAVAGVFPLRDVAAHLVDGRPEPPWQLV